MIFRFGRLLGLFREVNWPQVTLSCQRPQRYKFEISYDSLFAQAASLNPICDLKKGLALAGFTKLVWTCKF